MQLDNNVNVIVKEDKSVEKKLNKTAKKLKKNHERNHTINEKRLPKKKNLISKIVSIFFDVVCACMVLACGTLIFSNIVCRFQKVNPSFAGYSQFKISSKSMVASGFYVGDNIMIRSVDSATLNVGDKIAFYVYPESYNKFKLKDCEVVTEETELVYDVSFKEFFGIQPTEIKDAAKFNSRMVFHEIVKVYQDTETGKKWYQTKGTSNNLVDSWYVEDTMVIGIYDDSETAVFLANVFTKLSSSQGLIVLIIIPVLVLGFMVILEFLKDVETAKLELDIVQEKRKLTDPICVEHEIGFKMDTKTKYKVLAQASEDERVEYLSLLWKDGSAPNSIKKYCIRKEILLETLSKELDVHRRCDEMFKEGVPDKKIAEFYHKEKDKIDKEYKEKQRELKLIKKYVK